MPSVVCTICLCLGDAEVLMKNTNETTNNELQKAKNIVGVTTLSIDLNFKSTTPPNANTISTTTPTTNTTTTKPATDVLPQAKNNDSTIQDPKGSAKEMEKVKNEFEDNDYAFLSDRIPDLPEDEYIDLDGDSTPLHFLKRTSEKQEQTQTNRKGGAPVYITIPIYISMADKFPLAITIGGREVPLNTPQTNDNVSAVKTPLPQTTPTKAPNSHFNRLLNHVETPKRRTTNRHRSSVRSKIYARKDRNSPVVYAPLEYFKTRARSSGRTVGKYF